MGHDIGTTDPLLIVPDLPWLYRSTTISLMSQPLEGFCEGSSMAKGSVEADALSRTYALVKLSRMANLPKPACDFWRGGRGKQY